MWAESGGRGAKDIEMSSFKGYDTGATSGHVCVCIYIYRAP